MASSGAGCASRSHSHHDAGRKLLAQGGCRPLARVRAPRRGTVTRGKAHCPPAEEQPLPANTESDTVSDRSPTSSPRRLPFMCKTGDKAPARRRIHSVEGLDRNHQAHPRHPADQGPRPRSRSGSEPARPNNCRRARRRQQGDDVRAVSVERPPTPSTGMQPAKNRKRPRSAVPRSRQRCRCRARDEER